MVFAATSCALLNSCDVFPIEEGKELKGLVLDGCKHFFCLVRLACDDTHHDHMDWFGVFSGLQCELDVVEALVADHVGIVVRVKDLHRQLHSVIEKACLKLGAIKLSRDVLHNKSVTSELGLLGSGELTA